MKAGINKKEKSLVDFKAVDSYSLEVLDLSNETEEEEDEKVKNTIIAVVLAIVFGAALVIIGVMVGYHFWKKK